MPSVHQPGRVFHALKRHEKVAVVPANDSVGLQHAYRHSWKGWDMVDASFPALPGSFLHRQTSLSALQLLNILVQSVLSVGLFHLF